jgi:hypothetical protein
MYINVANAVIIVIPWKRESSAVGSRYPVAATKIVIVDTGECVI